MFSFAFKDFRLKKKFFWGWVVFEVMKEFKNKTINIMD